MKTVLHYLDILFQQISGTDSRGIRNRTWIAIVVAILATVVDTACVCYAYDYIPGSVPLLRDWDNHVVEWISKSSFFSCEFDRLLLLTFMLACGFAYTLNSPGSILAKRTRCLLAETSMLIIATGVGISMVELSLSLGDNSQIISDYWEWTIMLFCFALLLIEFIHDYVKLKSFYKS